MSDDDARRTFLADQQRAASADAASDFTARALTAGLSLGEIARIGATSPVRVVLDRLIEGVLAGRVTRCEHLDDNAPGRQFWIAGVDPDHLLCQACVDTLHLRVDLSALPRVAPCTACGFETDQLHGLNGTAGAVGISAMICDPCYSGTRPS